VPSGNLFYTVNFSTFASPCSVTLENSDQILTTKAVTAVIAEAKRIEVKFSRFNENSLLSYINKNAANHIIPLDSETELLLRFAEEMYMRSNGLFDITSGVLQRLWRAESLPSDQEIASALQLVGMDKLATTKAGLKFLSPGIAIDFGGLGKEYAVDRASLILSSLGIKRALVNFGGDIRVLGEKEPGVPWLIGITDPVTKTPYQSVPLVEGSLATSGDYERYIEINGKRYSHLINPKSGYPAEGHYKSVSIISNSSIVAGAIATTVMIGGEGALRNFEDEYKEVVLIR
jgi:thiamine biosynthesis lipoprotein